MKSKPRICKNPNCKNVVVGTKGKLYCCRNCSYKTTYQKNKEKYLANSRNWAKNNPDRMKELKKKSFEKFIEKNPNYYKEKMKENYQLNKKRWDSRSITWRIISGGKVGKYFHKPYPLPNPNCIDCNTSKKLHIHCEVFLTKKKEIIKAINEKKIYRICGECKKKRVQYNA